MTILFNYVMPTLFFCYVLAHLLYKEQNIDVLRLLAWKAFGLTMPIVIFFSFVVLREPWLVSFKRIFFAACFLLMMQLSRPLISWLPKFLRRPLNYLCAAIDDFFAFLTFFILHRRQCWQTSRQESLGSGKIPILLIHGYGHDAGAWCYHRPRLAQSGIGPLFTIDLGSPTHSIGEYARRVQQKAEKIAAIAGTKNLILVGYSMGGLVAADYALRLAAEGTVKGVITIGSPFEGTRMAIFGNGLCAKQMHYRTPFLKGLKEKVVANGIIPFCHIGTHSDTIVRPASSSWPTGVSALKIIFEDFGHLSLLYSETITKTLCVCLNEIQQSPFLGSTT